MIVIPADSSCTPYLQPQQFGVRDMPLPDDPPHFVTNGERRLRKEASWDSDQIMVRSERTERSLEDPGDSRQTSWDE